jgi:hypothetical protein
MFKQPTTGGGAYLKLEEFEDCLVLFRPESIDQVPAYKKPGEFTDEVTAHWVAFGPDGEDVRDGAKFKGGTLVRAAKQAMKSADFPWVLGVLCKVPTKDTKETLKIEYTPEDYKAARNAWLRGGGKGFEPKHAWTLAEFTDDQAERAGKYVTAYNAKANPFVGAPAE